MPEPVNPERSMTLAEIGKFYDNMTDEDERESCERCNRELYDDGYCETCGDCDG